MSVSSYGGDSTDAYVMRTTDGGAVWHPQEITSGSIVAGGLVATSGQNAAALIDGTSVTGESLHRLLFSTQTGGDVTGIRRPPDPEHLDPRVHEEAPEEGKGSGPDHRRPAWCDRW